MPNYDRGSNLATIYVFGEPGSLIVKVGKSYGLAERERDLRRDWAMPNGRVLYAHTSATGLAERAAHRLLKQQFWLQGEWFVCGEEIAIRAVKHATRVYWRERRRSMWRGEQRRLRRIARKERG